QSPSSPGGGCTAVLPVSTASATRACPRSLPSSQSKLFSCSPSRSGAWSGSWIFANETLREAVRWVMASAVGAEGVREAAKRGPALRIVCTHAHARQSTLLRTSPDAWHGEVRGSDDGCWGRRQRKATAYSHRREMSSAAVRVVSVEGRDGAGGPSGSGGGPRWPGAATATRPAPFLVRASSSWLFGVRRGGVRR